jgi:hypothetical protein
MRTLSDGINQIENRTSATTGLNGHEKLFHCVEMTLDYQPKYDLPALTLNNTVLIKRSEIFALLSLPGAGKTTLTEGLVAAQLASKHNISGVDTFGFQYNSIGLKCLLVDTERPPDDCSTTYQNIYKRLGKPDRILTDDKSKIANFTHLMMSEIADPNILRKTLEYYVKKGEYEFVLLDGVLDFCLSMLDDKDATTVVKWIRALAVKYNCAFVVTIHPNKGTSNPAGHIGSFLLRWSRAMLVIKTSTDKHIKEISTDFEHAKLSHGNMAAFTPTYFSWNNSLSMMMTCNQPEAPNYKINILKQAVMELRLKGINQIPSADMKKHYSALSGLKPETAKKHILKAVADGLLVSIGEGKATKYIPSTDWDLTPTHSGTVAPYIYKGAAPESDSKSETYPNNTHINGNGYGKAEVIPE